MPGARVDGITGRRHDHDLFLGVGPPTSATSAPAIGTRSSAGRRRIVHAPADRAPMGVRLVRENEAPADAEIRFGGAIAIVVVEERAVLVEVARIEIEVHGDLRRARRIRAVDGRIAPAQGRGSRRRARPHVTGARVVGDDRLVLRDEELVAPDGRIESADADRIGHHVAGHADLALDQRGDRADVVLDLDDILGDDRGLVLAGQALEDPDHDDREDRRR